MLDEHMADYHCQDTKGWGSKTAHDSGGINPAKLNDGGKLVQLWPPTVRGRGIDAVWKTTGAGKPYAIVEAKASLDPTKSLNSLLGEAWDKTERSDGKSAQDSGAGGGLRGKGQSKSSSKASVRQTNGKVTQMGHAWIQNTKRLARAVGATSTAYSDIHAQGEKVYSRHVLFFSIPHAEEHAEALIRLIAKRSVPASFHAAHEFTREWGDSSIDTVVDNRAGLDSAPRKA